MEKIQAGTILIADPFLKDPNFLRTVILLCNYDESGSFGFVLNRTTEYNASDLLNDFEECDLPVFYGGPVQQNSIHFLHCCPDLISGGEHITGNIFWGGEFEKISSLLKEHKINQNQIKLFLGYSGWGEMQLEDELKEKTWLTTHGTDKLVFIKNIKDVWPEALRQMGGKYKQLINYPTDPQLN